MVQHVVYYCVCSKIEDAGEVPLHKLDEETRAERVDEYDAAVERVLGVKKRLRITAIKYFGHRRVARGTRYRGCLSGSNDGEDVLRSQAKEPTKCLPHEKITIPSNKINKKNTLYWLQTQVCLRTEVERLDDIGVRKDNRDYYHRHVSTSKMEPARETARWPIARGHAVCHNSKEWKNQSNRDMFLTAN